MTTAVAHLPSAPAAANLDRGARWAESEIALADTIDETGTPIASPMACNGAIYATQQRNVSDGGRGPIEDGSKSTSCRKHRAQKPRTRQVVAGDLDLSQMQSPEPLVLKFEAVIRIDLSALVW